MQQAAVRLLLDEADAHVTTLSIIWQIVRSHMLGELA